MQFGIYNDILRFICRHQILWEVVMTGGCYFTLAFEIGYTFLIWHRRTPPVALAGAIVLHGTIGIFMGLKTFSLLMLVMNLAFVRPEEIRWFLSRVSSLVRGTSASDPAAAAGRGGRPNVDHEAVARGLLTPTEMKDVGDHVVRITADPGAAAELDLETQRVDDNHVCLACRSRAL